MTEILRTNDLVLISFIEALFASERIDCFVADRYMSAIEGSLGFLPRRILVPDDQRAKAVRVLREAGLEDELRQGGAASPPPKDRWW